jgi:hypothetical protein
MTEKWLPDVTVQGMYNSSAVLDTVLQQHDETQPTLIYTEISTFL